MLKIGEEWSLDVDRRGNLIFIFKGRVCGSLLKDGMFLVRDALTTQDYAPTQDDLEQMERDAREWEQREALRQLPRDHFYES